MITDDVEAIADGLIEELNLRWRRSDFYFYKQIHKSYCYVQCCQHYHGKFRICLTLSVADSYVLIFDAVGMPKERKFLLADPDCIAKLHSAIGTELFKAT